jgi:predicted secreted Zn-dependent protease
MDADINVGSGKTSAPNPSRTWADDASSDDDDCVILEVYGRVPISYAYSVDPALADPDTHVLEDTDCGHEDQALLQESLSF